MPDFMGQRRQEREIRIAREKEEMHRMMENNVFSKMGKDRGPSIGGQQPSPLRKKSPDQEVFVPGTLSRPLLF
jgi:hypothetical protein